MSSKTLVQLKKASFVILPSLVISSIAFAYLVKKGDSLSKIAAKHLGTPVYGKSGNLKKILQANKGIKNPNLILVGQKIVLPGEAELQASHEEINRELATTDVNETAPLQVSSSAPAPVGYGAFGFESQISSVKINGSMPAANAALASNSNFGGALHYTQMWNQNFESDFFFGFHKLSMNQPSTGGLLDNSDSTLYSFGAKGIWNLNPKLSIGGGLGIFQRTYLKAISTTTVRLDPLSVPQVSVLGNYDFYNQKPFTLGARLGLGLDLPQSSDTYDTRLNPSYLGALYVRHEVSEKLQTEVGIKGEYLIENTSIANQSETDLGIYLKLKFVFGKKEQ